MGRIRIACSLLALAGAAIAQTDWDAIELETIDLGDGVYMIGGFAGNVGLTVGDDGVVLIDDKFAPLTPKLLAAVEDAGGDGVDILINTHWHHDHTGGNENFGRLGVQILAHDNVRRRLSTRQVIKAFGAEAAPLPPIALPVITFSAEMTLHMNGHLARVVHVPHAHTDGDAMAVFEDLQIVIMGDVFFNGIFPFIDVGSGGHIDGVIAGQRAVLEHIDEDWKIVPGHGPLATKRELQETHDMLVTVRRRVTGLIDDGHSLGEIVASKPLADLEQRWGSGFTKADRIIEYVHDSLTSESVQVGH